MQFTLLKKMFFILLSFCTLSLLALDKSEMDQLKSLYPNIDISEYNSKYDNLKENKLGTTDTLLTDSLLDSSSTTNLSKANLSIYKMMVSGQEINPDTALKYIEIFGQKTFKSKNITHKNSANSVPSNYTISTGDEIIIQLWGRINESHKLVVNRNGSINIPRIGPVNVAGLTFSALQKNIGNQVKKINGIDADISIGKLNAVKIFIVGEVQNPGQYSLPALSGVIDALISAGGFSNNGSIRSVKLKRGSKTIASYDLYKFLLSGNRFSNRRLLSGDVIYVPVAKKFATIAGNVRRSAIYELQPSMSSLKDLISLSGGFTPSAWTNRIQVQKFINNNHKTVLDIQIDDPKNIPDIQIDDGDIVKVFPILNSSESSVHLFGNVNRPGKYEFKDGMRVSDLVNSYSDLKINSFLRYALIKRVEKNSVSEQLLSFNLLNVITDSSSKDNILLQPKDEVTIYNRDFFEPKRTVYIGGAVNIPGSYNLMENMTIKDLILKAGGLSHSASVIRGEIYKRSFQGDSVTTSKNDFTISSVLNDKNPLFILSKGDYIFIRSKKAWDDTKKIALLGQFNYPGEYVILENETLGDVIKRAGGFRKNADFQGAIYTRESIKKLEKKRTDEYINNLEKEMMTISSQMVARGSASADIISFMDQQQKMLNKLKKMKHIGRLVIDLNNKSDYDNVLMDDLDTIYMPKNTGMVSVIGEIFNPSTFILSNKRLSVNDYIEKSGGLKQVANKKNIYIIKANGSVKTKKMVNFNQYSLESNDVVIVPKKLPYNSGRFKIFMSTLDAISKLTAITANTASAVATIKILTEN